MPISPTLPTDGESNWDVPLNAALTEIVDEVNAQETDIAGKADTSHTHAAADVTSGTIATARLGSGTADNTKFLRGDQTWAAPAGSGAVDSVNGATGVVVLDQDDVLDGTTYKQYSATEKTKLAGVASGATANDTDSNLKNRSNHTGTQTASTISDFASTVRATTGSDTQAGSLELATDAEAVTGTDTARATTPANVAAVVAATRARYSAVNAQTGTTYAPVLGDESKLVTLSNASSITVTMPSDATTAFPTGATIDFVGIGAGLVTFSAGSGATVNPTSVTRAQWSAVTAIKRASNTWLIVGDLA